MDSNGDLIFAQAKEIHITTNMEAEAIAIREALQYCVSNHIFQVIIETDSLLMKKVLDNAWDTSWSIISIVEFIKLLIAHCHVIINPIFHEDYSLEDHLANYAFDVDGVLSINSFTELTPKG